MRRASATLWFLLAVPAWAFEQPTPAIDLDPAIECWYHSDYPMLGALVDPADEIVSSRLYFRCSLYRDYYFVDFRTDGTPFTAVAPQAEESCPSVHYYVEAVTRDFMSVRTPELLVEVTSHNECRRRHPAAAFFPGTDDPRIILGSTVAGPSLAPGFKSAGIGAFVSSTGSLVAATSSQGGPGALAVAGVAAGAAAAGAGVLVAANNGDSGPPEAPPPVAGPPVPPPPTTAVTTTPPTSQSVKACIEFTPIDAVIDVNEPLTVDARCSEGGEDLSYFFDLGDGRTREGQPFITVVYPNAGNYSMTLTVRRGASTLSGARLQDEDTISRTIRVNERFIAPVPDFVVRNIEPDACIAEFDASPSTGDIVEYLWQLDVKNEFREGVVSTSGRVVRHEWTTSTCRELKGIMTTRLTVVARDGARASTTKVVNVLGSFALETRSLRTSFTSELMAADASASANVILPDGRAQAVSRGVTTPHAFAGSEGRNVVEGVLLTPLASPTLWRFDFSATAHIVPGSLRLTSGTLVSRDGRSIVVRLAGEPGERVRIEFDLEH